MRLCYVVHSLHHFAAPYVDHFAARGHEVHVVSFTHAPLANAVNHHPRARDFDADGFGNLDYVRAIPAVRSLIRRIAPDLVHAHFLTSNGLVAAASGFHPLVVSARGSDVHYSMGRWLRRATIRFVMARADLVNPVSRELADAVVALGVPPAKVLCLTQGIDRTPFEGPRSPAPPDGPVRILCTRKLHHPYQPSTIVEALAELRRRGIAFACTFAAPGRDGDAVRALVRERGLADAVTFRNGYRPAELPGLLAAADVYVSASLWDGTSPALLEAMAAGLYPVVTDCPANREWITAPEGGRLFPADDVGALADALAAAAGDRGRWAAAAAHNQAVVAARADRTANLTLLGEHYERLVAGTWRRTAIVGGGGDRRVA